ncbi:Pentatricopeptide repeat-containing protein [Sesamum angolense]|uniref:Pentatricopeptide repeat-containing protein n=1 Tax=Sesamum angolense TaxID=2727404 RepID=A0AAE1X503_9LAMI|nr:Pentatricopeptide repeat-containing protein [Sesamum angolense]
MAFLRSMSKIPYHSFCYFPKPSSFSSSPPPLSGDALVSAAVSILKHQRSKSRWSNLRSLLTATKDKRLTASQFSEIAVQLRNNAHLAMRFFQFTVDHSLSSHSLYSYATVIHILARSRLKLHALNLIKSAMCRFPEAQQQVTATPVAILEALIITYRACASAPFVFDLLVRACLESKKIDIAVEIYAILKSKNVYLRTRTCNSLIESVTKSRGCFAGYNLYREIFNLDVDNVVRNQSSGKGVCPTANTLNVVMIGFYREGLVDKVEEVWQEFANVDCVPNIYSFNVLMAAYCDDRRMKDAMRLWEEMESRGLNHDAVAYNTVIGGFCGIGEVGRAEEIYREMVMKGVESTCITFEHLINGYCKIGDFDSVTMLYKDICRKNFCPGSSTVNVIIKSLCDKNKISAASEFYRMAVKKHDVVLEKENYENLMRGLCQEGKTEEALKLQVELVGKGFRPNSVGMEPN